MIGNCDAKAGNGFGIPLASPLLVIQPLATLEIVPPVFLSDAPARLAEVEDGTPIVSDAALAALSAMWATIFQQQVLPDQLSAGQLTLDGTSNICGAEDAQGSAPDSAHDLPIERLPGASASPKVIDLRSLLQGVACGIEPQMPIVNAIEPRSVGVELEAIQVPVALAGPSRQEVATAKPTEDVQDIERVLTVTSTEAETVDSQPIKKAKHLKTVVAAPDCPALKIQLRERQPGEDMQAASVADAITEVAEVTQAPEHQSVVGFRKQIREKLNLDVAEAVTSLSSAVRAQHVEQGTASTIAEAPSEDAGLAAAEVKKGEVVPKTPEAFQPEPQTALKDCELPPATVKQDSIAVQANRPNATAGIREQWPIDSRQPAQAASRPNAPVEAELPASFGALSPRESRTISIRIPLTDSTWKPGSPAAHIDLVFHQRNHDLTLQFRSPSSEIQRNLDESMPMLIDRLKNENWAVRPQDSPVSVLPAEPSLDGRRRGDLLQPAAPVLETSRQIATQAQSGSQGFSFDDQAPNQSGAREQKQGRNRNREQVFQSEFDEQQQS